MAKNGPKCPHPFSLPLSFSTRISFGVKHILVKSYALYKNSSVGFRKIRISFDRKTILSGSLAAYKKPGGI